MAEESEKATLIVGGQKYEDWESVWYQYVLGSDCAQFKFTAAERDPTADLISKAQLKPGDECQIFLAGKVALENGVILTRQAAFEKGAHGVELRGVSRTWPAARSSIIHDTNNFDKKTFKEIAEEVLKPTGVKVEFKDVSDEKFERMHVKPGETIFAFLERLARLRNLVVTGDPEGKFLIIGKQQAEKQGNLEEGKNILKCQAIISDQFQRSLLVGHAQSPGNDKNKYRKASEQEAKAKGEMKLYSAILIPVEQPTWTDKELEKRVNMEAKWTKAQQIQVTCVVQGWQVNGNGELWKAGKSVNFNSRMAMINQELAIQSVTYTQDNQNGSLTTLLLVAPWGLNTQRGALPASAMQPPADAKADKSAPKVGQ